MAYQRWWKTIRDQQGNAVNGAYCAVYNGGTGTLATIYDPNTDDSAPGNLANPFVTTANGVFGFMAADGEYDIQISGGALATQQYRVFLGAATTAVIQAEYEAADAVVTSNFQAADAGIVSSYQAADAVVTSAFQSADAVVTSNFQAADGVVAADAAAATAGVYSDLAASSGAGLVGYLPPFTGSVARTQADKNEDVVTSADFAGVDASGVTDSADGLNKLLSCGAKRVRILAGTYKIGKTLVIPDGVSVEGDGIGATILDGSGATFANLTNGYHITTAGGTWTQIPDLSVNVVKGQRTLTFASAPTLVPGDVICIYNPTDSSWSGFRTYYRAGEYLRVAKVSGTTVTLQSATCDDYTYTAVDVYRLDSSASCHLSGFTLKGLAGASGAVVGINFLNVVDGSITDVRVTNCSYNQISVNQCFNVALTNTTCEEDFTDDFSGDYGLTIANSHAVSVRGGYYSAARHGITTGGSTGVGCVSCRFIYISALTVSSTGAIQSMDFHGNTEYAWVDGCVLDGGFAGGGDYIHITNNQFKGAYGNGNIACYLAEMRGLHWVIGGNTIWSNQTTGSRAAFIDLGGGGSSITTSTVKGGTISITNNKFVWDLAGTPDGTASIIKVTNSGFNPSEKIRCVISGNDLVSNFKGGSVEVSVSSGRPWDLAEFSNNSLDGAVIRLRHTVSSAGNYSALVADVRGNNISNGWSYGVYLTSVRDFATITGNKFYGVRYAPVLVDNNGGTTKVIEVSNNTMCDFLMGRTSSSTTNAAVNLATADLAIVRDNLFRSNTEYLVVASNAGFVIGETITGGTSGATATVVDTRSTTDICIGTTRSLGFTIAETITGGTSGATTTVTAAEQYVQVRRIVLSTVTSALMRGNLDPRVTIDSFTSVTGYASGNQLSGSATYDPPNLADGAGATTTVTVTGAALGDYASASFSLDTAGITITAWVSAANTVSVRFQNESGGPLDILSGTLRATVTKP